MNKYLARRLAQARLRARKPQQQPTAPRPNDVRRPPDTWSPQQIKKFHQEVNPEETEKGPDRRPWGRGTEVPEISTEAPESIPTSQPSHKALSKSRRTKLTISMSEEEAHIVREWLNRSGRSLGEWGREVLFAAMGRNIPPRH